MPDAQVPAAAHFVTVRVAGRRALLGSVEGARVRLTEAGEIVRQEWLYTAIMRADVAVDRFVVMPDHIHGILVIDGGAREARSNVGAIVGGFKAACSIRINQSGEAAVGQIWQRGFYDRPIREGADLARTRQRMDDNPRRWWVGRYGTAFPSASSTVTGPSFSDSTPDRIWERSPTTTTVNWPGWR